MRSLDNDNIPLKDIKEFRKEALEYISELLGQKN
jgi:hypothetical protein